MSVQLQATPPLEPLCARWSMTKVILGKRLMPGRWLCFCRRKAMPDINCCSISTTATNFQKCSSNRNTKWRCNCQHCMKTPFKSSWSDANNQQSLNLFVACEDSKWSRWMMWVDAWSIWYGVCVCGPELTIPSKLLSSNGLTKQEKRTEGLGKNIQLEQIREAWSSTQRH